MKTDGVMEAARRLHFDLTMCFSCSFFDDHKANVMPAIERTVVSDLPSHRPVDETLHSVREMSVFLKQQRSVGLVQNRLLFTYRVNDSSQRLPSGSKTLME
jgi:hypothetical protein